MHQDDFDIDSLANYLHLSRERVSRMAERGKLPGRKVAGQWRFARAEIHHWLEHRIGGLDEEELVQLEGALERSATEHDIVSIAEMLPVEAIAIPLEARTRSSVVREMVGLAEKTGWLWDPRQMAEAVREREDMHPTALDNGVALLHPRRPLPRILAQAFLAVGRTDTGIPFGAQRGTLTDLFVLICSVDDQGHLRTLARLSRLLADAQFLNELRAVPDAQRAHHLIVEREAQLLD